MQNYQETSIALHNREILFSPQDYTFVTMIVLGEDLAVAYAVAYSPTEYKKVMGTGEEQLFLDKAKREAESNMKQQHIVQLKEELAEAYRADIQQKALSLEQIEFTAADINALLNKLLATQAKDLDSASIREMLSIIHELVNNFGLSSGNDAFAKHFITIHPKFTSLCSCGHEFDVIKGLDCVCPYCKKVYTWVEEEDRFYPQPTTL